MSEVLRRELRQSAPFRSLEEEVVLLLQMAAHRVNEPFARALRKAGRLTPHQYNVLRILRGAGPEGLPSGEIGCRMIARDPDVTRLVDRLAAQKLVRRGTEGADRRVVRVHITERGLALLAELDGTVDRYPVDTLAGLDPERLGQLRDLLERVIDTMGAGGTPHPESD